MVSMMYFFFLFIHLGCSSQNTSAESSLLKEERTKNIAIKTPDGQSKTSSKNPIKTVEAISVTELFQIYSSNQKEGPIIIDVRTSQEYDKMHIPTAIHIPLQEISHRAGEIEKYLKGKNKEIYLVCAVGGRSFQGAEVLAKMGFEKPINVMGGTNGWVALGFPTEQGSTKSSEKTP